MTSRKPRHPKRMINPPACPRCTLNNISAKKSEEGLRDCEAQLLEMADFSLAMLQALSYAHLAAELNMSAYEDAQMHARTEHSLLTEANAEIEKLRIELAGATGESWGYLAANGHLNDYIDELRAEVAQMSETIEVGGIISRTNRLFTELRRIGEVDDKGKVRFARGFRGKQIAMPDAPLQHFAILISTLVIKGFTYSSPEAAAADIEGFKKWANSLRTGGAHER
jgi:oligoendopeptidase F